MTDGKKWGQTVLGWFIVQDGQSAEEGTYRPFEDASGTEATAGESEPVVDAPVPDPPPFTGPVPQVQDGKVPFESVFEAAGVDAEEQARVTKAKDLLGSLPAGTDDTVKKQIVHASLKAFGVEIDKIIEAGVAEIQALESYIRNGATDTQKVIEESDDRIRRYEEEIKQLRVIMQQRVEEQQQVVRSCNEKKLEVQQILEFFGRENVERVVKASPKLVDPSAPPAQ
jgi:hypothetical protein